MTSPDKVALFDLDGTLADYDAGMIRDLELIAAPNEVPIDYHCHDLPEWAYARIKLIRNQPGWWERLAPIESGFEVFRAVRRIGYQISVLTKGPDSAPDAWTEKFRWCKNHLPGVQVTITQDKSAVYGRVLVDDYPDYCLAWLQSHKRGLVIMPATAQNAEVYHDRLVRYTGDNIAEVERVLTMAYNRQPGELVDFRV